MTDPRVEEIREQFSSPTKNYPLCDTTYATAIDSVKYLLQRLDEMEKEINRLSNIIRDEGWAIPDGTLRLGLVSAQEKNAELEIALAKAEANVLTATEARKLWGDRISDLESSLSKERDRSEKMRKICEYVNEFLPDAMELLEEVLEDAKRCYSPEKGWPPHIEAAKAMILKGSDQWDTLKDVEEALNSLEER